MPAASPGDVDRPDESTKARSRALNDFLANVEVRAFRIAQLALRQEDDALDVVQDAMLRLARFYGARPEGDWKPLFYRILENRIRDVQRRRKVRNRVIAWLPFRRGEEDDEAPHPVDQAVSRDVAPADQLELDQAIKAVDAAVRTLPRRQQQAFLLRTLEGMSVAETAVAMGCTEGSVKTHYFRALNTLRAQLGELLS